MGPIPTMDNFRKSFRKHDCPLVPPTELWEYAYPARCGRPQGICPDTAQYATGASLKPFFDNLVVPNPPFR